MAEPPPALGQARKMTRSPAASRNQFRYGFSLRFDKDDTAEFKEEQIRNMVLVVTGMRDHDEAKMRELDVRREDLEREAAHAADEPTRRAALEALERMRQKV